VVTLPDGLLWLNKTFDAFFVRQSYIDLFDECEKRRTTDKGVIITGNPGKSPFPFISSVNCSMQVLARVTFCHIVSSGTGIS